MMRRLDYPPVWTAAALVAQWSLSRIWSPDWPAAIQIGLIWAGPGMSVLGMVLMLLAVTEMRRAKTTVIPHRLPQALVTSGVFAFSRNPIYLGDVLLVLGHGVFLGTPLVLVSVPLLALILRARFILPEEARLRAAFGAPVDEWFARTRRWL
jgi:protein-S-isoprenylcysteine O-methyltransferase Ste14